MASSNKTDLWKRIKRNPTLHDLALSDEEGLAFKWHDFAHSPRSSQVFCVSAFGTARQIESRDRVVAALLTKFFPQIATKRRPREWSIYLEKEWPELLGEQGTRQPTSVDALCVSSREVICIESKFVTDAREGFGTCSQAKNGHCRGFYGPGSDKKPPYSTAWCRLEIWEGKRAPRLYWPLGRAYFRPEVFRVQAKGDACPFRLSTYQLMRNFLFAAAFAERERRSFFGVLAICPRGTADTLEKQLDEFRREILMPRFRERIRLAYYEDYIEFLRGTRDTSARDLASFLEERINSIIGSA